MSTRTNQSSPFSLVSLSQQVLAELNACLLDPVFDAQVREIFAANLHDPESLLHLSISDRGVRAALAAACLKSGYSPETVADLPALVSPETPSPAAIFAALSTTAAQHTCAKPLNTIDWERNSGLRMEAMCVYWRFVSALMSVAQTEKRNAEIVRNRAERGHDTPYALISVVWRHPDAGIDAFNLWVGFSDPDQLMGYAEVCATVPPDHRVAMTVELQRCFLAYAESDAIGISSAHFGAMLRIVSAIYG